MPGTANWYIKRGNLEPPIGPVSLKAGGVTPATPIPGDATVKFWMRDKLTHEVIIDRANAAIANNALWTVTYTWQAGDTDVYGRFEASFIVVYASGREESYPNSGFYIIDIEDDEGAG
jgi:hypothetical protein